MNSFWVSTVYSFNIFVEHLQYTGIVPGTRAITSEQTAQAVLCWGTSESELPSL
jgi:hypothetical protein